MKYDFNGEELNVLLMSLIGRRNDIKGLLDNAPSSDIEYHKWYSGELKIVESLLEKFFPGSMKSLDKAA